MADSVETRTASIARGLVESGPYYLGTLSPQSRRLLTLPPAERPEPGLKNLAAELLHLHDLFRSFSSRQLEHLARHLRLVREPANEGVLGPGSPTSAAAYVVLSGVLEMRHPAEPWPGRLLGRFPDARDCFGLDDLAMSRPPSVAVNTVGPCELLALGREDAGPVLEALQAVQAVKALRLRTAPGVARFGWSEPELEVLESFADLRTYGQGREVYRSREDGRKSYRSYFVVAGECRVVVPAKASGGSTKQQEAKASGGSTKQQEATASGGSRKQREEKASGGSTKQQEAKASGGSPELKLKTSGTRPRCQEVRGSDGSPEQQDAKAADRSHSLRQIVAQEMVKSSGGSPKHFREVKILKKGSFFGVGERLTSFSVVANTIAECLILPRFLLMHQDGALLRQMTHHIEATWPIEPLVATDSAEPATINPFNVPDRLREELKEKVLEEVQPLAASMSEPDISS